MDDSIVRDTSSTRAVDTTHVIDGIEVASFQDVVSRLCAAYPLEDPVHVEAIVLREWEAFSAGRPLVVPTAVEEGAREILDQSTV